MKRNNQEMVIEKQDFQSYRLGNEWKIIMIYENLIRLLDVSQLNKGHFSKIPERRTYLKSAASTYLKSLNNLNFWTLNGSGKKKATESKKKIYQFNKRNPPWCKYMELLIEKKSFEIL